MSLNASQLDWTSWKVFDPAEIAKIGQTQVNALTEVQRKLSDLFQEANQEWRSRTELERDLAADLTRKLSGAKSLPDVATICNEWMVRHVELATKDSQKFFANSTEIVSAMYRLLPSNGQTSNPK